MKFLCSLLLVCICVHLHSQVNDDFSDGNFTVNPAWTGDASHFTVNSSKQLQVNNTVAASSYLSTGFVANGLKKYRWEFFIKLSFSPSSSNYSRVYLVSNKSNLNDSLEGYYLQFGEALSNDKIELFRQSGKSSTSLCRGITSIANSFAVRLKVECDSAGKWDVYMDPSGGSNYQPEASGLDAPVFSSLFLGVFCVYTLSNSGNFYFDDFSAGPIIADTTSPWIDSLQVRGSKQLRVFFNEELDSVSSQNPLHYVAGKGVGAPVSAIRNPVNQEQVDLVFQNDFPGRTYISFSASGIRDLSMNTSALFTDSFLYVVPALYDVVFNEIMADPDPPVSTLPNYEYIELYNRTGIAFNLKKWKLIVGSNMKELNPAIIQPDSFIVLCSSSAAAAFGSSIQTLTVSGFPALTNTGQQLVLSDSSGTVISSVLYTDKWYKTPEKEEGGWSLEQVDPLAPCSGEENWKASGHPDGGTPGRSNSVKQSGADKTPPILLRALVIAPDTICLYFSEAVNPQQAMLVSHYRIDPGMGSPLRCIPVKPDYKSVLLVTPGPILAKTVYTLSLVDTVSDCSGNVIAMGSHTPFALAEKISAGDVVINEVLFDPPSGVPEFVEIVNASDKPLDLAELRISTWDTISQTFTDICAVTQEQFLFFPGEYRVLSTHAIAIKNKYSTDNPAGFSDLVSFPSLNNGGDVIVLSDSAGNKIDQFQYKPSMHFPLLRETKGISLERISISGKTQAAANWHSAAASAGYATPARKNSQSPAKQPPIKEFSLEPEFFSPDNDGFNDILTISYHLKRAGYITNLYIYNAEGELIRQLAKNESIGSEASFFWDGVNEKKEKVSSGIYIILAELFDYEGNIQKIKHPCVLANRY